MLLVTTLPRGARIAVMFKASISLLTRPSSFRSDEEVMPDVLCMIDGESTSRSVSSPTRTVSCVAADVNAVCTMRTVVDCVACIDHLQQILDP